MFGWLVVYFYFSWEVTIRGALNNSFSKHSSFKDLRWNLTLVTFLAVNWHFGHK